MAQIKEFTCKAGDVGSIPGLGKSPGEEDLPTPVLLSGKSHGQRSLWVTLYELLNSHTRLTLSHKGSRGFQEAATPHVSKDTPPAHNSSTGAIPMCVHSQSACPLRPWETLPAPRKGKGAQRKLGDPELENSVTRGVEEKDEPANV